MSQIGLFPDGPLEGTIIGGKYRLERKISEGGGGIVWEAKDPENNSLALKFLKWSPLKSRDETAERFKNEFSILKSISHPNIARIYDFGHDPSSDLYFFTSELFNAGDLKALIKAPINIIEDLLLQALRSLEYLNNNRLLHLDIKPQNLLLKSDGDSKTLVLIDFGLATFRPPDRPGGTANYMPPELVVRRLGIKQAHFPPPDHRSDLYSLGVTFYYCLTGVQPFCARVHGTGTVDIDATLRNHIEIDPPPPSVHRPEIPSYLDRIIMRLMARQPYDRYPSAIVASQAIQYSSPRKYPPETRQTLLAYIPKEGKLIGRHLEIKSATQILTSAARGNEVKTPFICVAGRTGTGRSRFISSLKPIAQQLEMDVCFLDDSSKPLAMNENCHASKVLFFDGIENIASGDTGAGMFEQALKAFSRKIRLQMRLPQTFGGQSAFCFTVNTDKLSISEALSFLEVSPDETCVLELKNFNKTDVQEYLTALIGDTPSPKAIEQLLGQTGGNPYFMTEFLEAMIAGGNLFSLTGRPDAKTLKTIGVDFTQAPLPKSLSDSVLERLKSLTEDERDVALTLACWHRPASAEELKATSEASEVVPALLTLVRTGMLRKNSGDGRFSFSSALTNSIILKRTETKKSAHVHDRILRYLKAQPRSKATDTLPHVAYGSSPTSGPDPRIDALNQMATISLSENRLGDAVTHLLNADKLIPTERWEDHADLCVSIGGIFERANLKEDAQKLYCRILRLKAPKNSQIILQLISAECLGRLEMRRRNLKAARKIFEKAISLTKAKKDLTLWRMKIDNYLAGIELRLGNVELAIERFEHTAKMAKTILEKNSRLTITNNELGEALLRANRFKDSIRVLKEELKLAERSKDFERVANRLYLLGNAMRSEKIAQYDSAKDYYEKALETAKANRLFNLEIRIHNGLGNLYLKRGQPKLAIKQYSEGLKLSQQVDSFTTSVELMIGLGLASQVLRDHAATIEYFEAALDFSSGPKGEAAGLIRRYSATIFVALGDAYYQAKDYEKALEFLEKAKSSDKKSTLSPDLRYSVYGTLAEIHLDYNDIQATEKLMPLLEAISKSYPPSRSHLESLKKRFSSSCAH